MNPMNTTAPKIADSTRLTLADIASSGGDVESARGIMKAAADQEPANADLQLRYANALLDAGRPAEASAVAATALTKHPQDTALALKVGQMQLRAKDPAGAAATFQKAVGHGADGVAALNGLGVARVQQGDLVSATDAFRRAVTANPNDFASRNNLALALVLQGRSAEALPMLQSLAAEPGSPGRVKHNLALAYAEQGDTREAAAVLTGVVGPNEALAEAASLAIVKRGSPASVMSQLAPVELLGTNSVHPNANSSAAPSPDETQPVAPAAPQHLMPQAAASMPQVATAPQQGFTTAPLPAAETPKPAASPYGTAIETPQPHPIASMRSSGATWHEQKGGTQTSQVRQVTPAQAGLQFAAFDSDPPERVAPRVFHSGHVRVHIAAVPSQDAALALWRNLTDREPDLLSDRNPVIRKRRGGAKDPWNLGTGGFQDVAAAESFCRLLRERGPNCTVGL